MNIPVQHIIYTTGHSTHDIDNFIAMLRSFRIWNLVDIRRLPGSRKYPQFNNENLITTLRKNGINYIYSAELTGRRKARKDSKNTRWNNISFRSYADYMETEDFETAISELENIALQNPTAYMCSEAVWWRCHRALISDYLKAKGWLVLLITGIGKVREHSYTSPAQVSGNKISYKSQVNKQIVHYENII